MGIDDNKMPQIEILGRSFFYEIFMEDAGYDVCFETVFYNELRTKMVKKYWFFGPLVEVPNHRVAFTVPFSIEDHNITKDELRHKLERRVELLTRQKEIEKGQLI